jgi:hypothetical protein
LIKISIFQNSNENIVWIFALKFFVASCGHPESSLGLLGAFGGFLGLFWDLVINIIKI